MWLMEQQYRQLGEDAVVDTKDQLISKGNFVFFNSLVLSLPLTHYLQHLSEISIELQKICRQRGFVFRKTFDKSLLQAEPL